MSGLDAQTTRIMDHGKQHAVIDGVSPTALIVTGEGSGNVARGANNET